MTVTSGQMLAHYRLVEKIGEGGMGVVWKAVDTTLDRPVAIKILPPGFAADPERVARFEREARVVAALQHPGIAAVFSVHKDEGFQYLAMELVAGEDLSQILARGPLPLDEVLSLARHIAEALEAAHQAGVVHRDLKPANVKVTPEGRVKILDFGLAKVSVGTSGAVSSDPISLSPTVTAGTRAGVIMGTAPYMSPEQAKGKPVDRRTDLWAFGVILWEMLTGRRLFTGETTSEILAEILKTDPDFGALPAGTPAGIRRLLRRCLTRDPRSRLHDAADARLELEEAASGAADTDTAGAPGASGIPPAPAKSWRAWIPWALAGLLAVALVTTVDEEGRSRAPGTPSMTLGAPIPENVVLPDDERQILDLGQDGRDLVFVGVGKDSRWIYRRPMDRMEAVRVPGTEGASGVQLSPDGRWIAFVSSGRLMKVPIEGGTPVFLAEAPANRGVSWGAGDTIVFAPSYNSGIVRVPATGGAVETVTTPDKEKGERSHRWPQILPGGRWVLFTVGTEDSPGEYDDAAVDAFDLESGVRKRVLEGARMARFVPPDRILFQREASLLSQTIDPETLEVSGTPVSLVEGVGGNSPSGVGYWAAADDGALAYVPESAVSTRRELVLVDPDGGTSTLPLSPDSYWHPRFDPRGRRVAFSIGSGAGAQEDVWVYDLPSGRMDRLTFGSGSGIPCWSPDGERLAYARGGTGATGIFWKEADGSGAEEALVENPSGLVLIPDGFTPDGRDLLITQAAGGLNILMRALPPSGEPETLVRGGSAAALSPDGRYVAYTAPAGAGTGIFVTERSGGGGPWQISEDGGFGPVWSRDGTEIYFSRDNEILAAKISTAPAFRSDRPRKVLEGPYELTTPPARNFDVDPQGRFILLRRHIDSAPHSIQVLTGWRDKGGRG